MSDDTFRKQFERKGATGIKHVQRDPLVLNPRLYSQLKHTFGAVRISNQGVNFSARVVGHTPETRKVIVDSAGEYYRVCCPACRDTRFRLWINHRWDTEYEGERLFFLAVCYNEHCEGQQGFIKNLREHLERAQCVTNVATVNDAATMATEPGKVEVPGEFTRIDHLPDDHAAVRYIRDVRQLSVQELGELWHVSWCGYSTVFPPSNRLFFPIYDQEDDEYVLRGGQAHWLDLRTLNGTPPKGSGEVKWFTAPGTRASTVLYNGYRARRQKNLVVITEGAFDVMRLGPRYAVAIFGHTVSHQQRNLLWEHWGSKGAAAVLALDPDAVEERATIELESWFKNSGWSKFISLRLPEDKDIGDLQREEAWEIINSELSK